jgi:hypothetical protein
MNSYTITAATATLLVLVTAANGAPVIYSGFDAGAGSLATAPNATAAAAAFDAAVSIDSVTDFEAVDAPTEFSLIPDNPVWSSSRTNDSSCSAALCGYNTTAGGEYFALASGDTMTFTFNKSIDAFGAYFTGWQYNGQTITYTDGSTEVLDMPIGDNSAGGTLFFGFKDEGRTIASITYNSLNDIVSIDDVRLSVSQVPIPAAIWLFGSGLLGLVGIARRKMS